LGLLRHQIRNVFRLTVFSQMIVGTPGFYLLLIFMGFSESWNQGQRIIEAYNLLSICLKRLQMASFFEKQGE
jgi:hypothetical protein